MAQGAPKKSSKPNTAKSKRPAVLGPKRGGARVIAPKKTKLVAQKKFLKKHSAGLTALTEKNLAEKAGHLEILSGGKKQKKQEGKSTGNTSKRR